MNGCLIDVNFFIVSLLQEVRSAFSKNLLNTLLNVFKANNDYCFYLNYLSNISPHAVNIMAINSNIALAELNMDANRELDELLEKSIEILEETGDLTSDDDSNRATTTMYSTSAPSSPQSSVSNISEAFTNARLENLDRSIFIKEISQTITFFVIKDQDNENDVLSDIKNLLASTNCIYPHRKRFCVLLFYDKVEKIYNLMTRQVNTAKNAIQRTSDKLICGWTGMCSSITKTNIVKALKKEHRIYNIINNKFHNIYNINMLMDHISKVISDIETIGNEKKTERFSPYKLTHIKGTK